MLLHSTEKPVSLKGSRPSSGVVMDNSADSSAARLSVRADPWLCVLWSPRVYPFGNTMLFEPVKDLYVAWMRQSVEAPRKRRGRGFVVNEKTAGETATNVKPLVPPCKIVTPIIIFCFIIFNRNCLYPIHLLTFFHYPAPDVRLAGRQVYAWVVYKRVV